MVDSLVPILIALGAFGVLLPLIVFVHEYGHFKVARLCGVRVDTFSIGFGPSLLKWRDKQGTDWKIAAIPLGGFVKFFGDANAASAGTQADDESHGPATTQFGSEKDRLAALLTEEEKRVCFHFKPLWQRAAVVAAGPLANFLLAIVIFTGIFMTIGVTTVEPVVGRVSAQSAAEEAGFAPGDKILSVNGARVKSFDDLRMKVQLSSDSALMFEVEREGRLTQLTATPRRTTQTDAFGNEIKTGQLGIEAYRAPIVGGLVEEGAAASAGFQLDDYILKLDDTSVFTFSDIYRYAEDRTGETISVLVERDGRELRLPVTVQAISIPTDEGGEERVGRLGIAPKPYDWQRLNPFFATGEAIGQVGKILDGTFTYLGRLITFREDPTQLGGPVKIAKYAGQAASSGFDDRIEIGLGDRILASLASFLQLAALVSVSIGLLNLLPVPVLDGG
ncbi:MAG: RIP metalloprotease RseP, partial [Pseudomonadota bacterium]